MAKNFIFLIAGIILSILKWQRFIEIHIAWIIGCFVLWIISSYIIIHKRNKEKNTPRPVYLTKG